MVRVIKYGWPCPMDCVGPMSDIGVMANYLNICDKIVHGKCAHGKDGPGNKLISLELFACTS